MQPFRIQLLVLSFFDVPAFCFHLSMLIFIIAQIRKKATLFRQGFYYLYAVVSVVDLYYITVTYSLYRIPMFGFFVDAYVDWDAGAKFLYESTNFCAWFQVCAHTVIAINRFSAFFFAQRHQKMWRGKNIVRIVASLLVAVIPGFVPCIAEPVHYTVLDDGRIVLSYYKASVHEATKIASASYYIPLSLLAFVINIAGVVKYRKLVRDGVIRDFGQNQDIRLLVHSIFVLCIQMFRVTYYAVVLVGIKTLPADVALAFIGFLQDKLVIVTDTYSLVGSIFLFALSSNVRRGYLEFYGMGRSDVEDLFVSATANA